MIMAAGWLRRGVSTRIDCHRPGPFLRKHVPVACLTPFPAGQLPNEAFGPSPSGLNNEQGLFYYFYLAVLPFLPGTGKPLLTWHYHAGPAWPGDLLTNSQMIGPPGKLPRGRLDRGGGM